MWERFCCGVVQVSEEVMHICGQISRSGTWRVCGHECVKAEGEDQELCKDTSYIFVFGGLGPSRTASPCHQMYW
jgi:hypothetical protein